mgnify:CR=1 FL=1
MPVTTTNAAPLRTIWAPTGEMVCGPLPDALHAKAWGKLMVENSARPEATRLTADELSDWLDFHVLPLVGKGTRDRYREGADRWAARLQMAA